ncbi:MAG: nucleotide-binding domain containing protein, partial [Desulfosarcina sp.]
QLARATGWIHRAIDPSRLSVGDGPTPSEPWVTKLMADWRDDGLILSIAPLVECGLTEPPERVVQGLACLAAALLRAGNPDGVFLSGGDTAEAVWHRIGASALLVREEILPGLMRGNFIGGPFDGLSVVTKAGAFGTPDTLNRLIHALK